MKTFLSVIFSLVQFFSLAQQKRFYDLDTALAQPENVRSLSLMNYTATRIALPDSFLKLTQLNYLYLDFNHAIDYTSIFDLLSQLPNLRTLEIKHYVDSILPASIGKMKQLQYLKIGTEKLTMLPPEIEGMVSLEELEIDALGLRKSLQIPKEIGALHKLRVLELRHCSIKRLPDEIDGLVSLETLSLSGNRLTDLPLSIGRLSNLKELYLSSNRITAIPVGIYNLPSLEKLSLSDNKLTVLDSAIYYLENLKELYLNGNISITSLPENIGKLNKLENLNIERTQIAELPASLQSIQSLKRITMCSTLVKNTHLIDQNYKNIIYWSTYCRDLEKIIIDFDEKYGTYSTWMHQFKNDSLQLHYKYTYDEPFTVDESYTRYVVIKAAKKDLMQGYKIVVPDPTIEIFVSSVSTWNWGAYYHNIQGEITVLKINKKMLEVRVNLIQKYFSDFSDEWYVYEIITDKTLIFRKNNRKPYGYNVMDIDP